MERYLSTCQATVTLGKGSLSIPANDTEMLEDNCNVQVIPKCRMSSGGRVGFPWRCNLRRKRWKFSQVKCQKFAASKVLNKSIQYRCTLRFMSSDLCVSCNRYLASFTVCCCNMKHAAVRVSVCAAVEAYLLIWEQKNPVFKMPWIVIQYNAYLYFAWPLRTLQRQSASRYVNMNYGSLISALLFCPVGLSVTALVVS